jgi:chromosome segregation ATPase
MASMLTAYTVQLKAHIATLERSIAEGDAALATERSNASTLRLRITELTTQLEVAHASQSSTAENATAASSRVAELSKKLGDANEEVLRNVLEFLCDTVCLTARCPCDGMSAREGAPKISGVVCGVA